MNYTMRILYLHKRFLYQKTTYPNFYMHVEDMKHKYYVKVEPLFWFSLHVYIIEIHVNLTNIF